MHIRAVLFDLDNTLFDHSGSAHTALYAFAHNLGIILSDKLAQQWFDIEQACYDRFLNGGFSFQDQRRERLRRFFTCAGLPCPGTAVELDRIFATYLRKYEAAWTAFPDAAPALRQLHARGMTVGVITNGNHEQQQLKVHKTGLEPLLDAVFTSGQMGHAKPTRDAFLVPCKSLGLPPGQVLYVGDNYKVDVEGAQAAGLHAVHLDRKSPCRPASLSSLRQLMAHLSEVAR